MRVFLQLVLIGAIWLFALARCGQLKGQPICVAGFGQCGITSSPQAGTSTGTLSFSLGCPQNTVHTTNSPNTCSITVSGGNSNYTWTQPSLGSLSGTTGSLNTYTAPTNAQDTQGNTTTSISVSDSGNPQSSGSTTITIINP